jgi:threonine dehydrogenase-like Zn-dependent dehydrogenase
VPEKVPDSGLGILCSILLSYGDGWPTPGSVAYEARNVSGRQAIALFARAAGAARVLIAGSADALRFDVQRALGFNDLLDVADAPLKDLVQQATIGRLVNVAIEATGYPPSIVDGLGVLRTAGALVGAGIHPGPVSRPLTDFVRARHQLRATHGCAR